ncbi:hypothetical protein [Aquimarina algicola]|uniref:Uncharacterized protein n=1 Tax=Aquimarina algicola TaxID=2589995 RepID=A0A504JG43_9FLAO|nr:hypothetical protein [Aquimarina algicola]TPN87435.1 hypothetical protein FHK87_07590 [Aquimarina algicola]
MSKVKRERVERWLILHKDSLRIASIERQLGFSRGILAKFYKEENKRILKKEEVELLDKWIKKLIDSYEID